MLVLALDTSLGAVSVALAVGPSDAGGAPRVAHRFERRANGHAERFFDLLEDVLTEAAVEARAIRRVAVTLGPGTFTGVRTGVAIARAMALSTGCEVVGVSSLHLMALGARRLLLPGSATGAGTVTSPPAGQTLDPLLVAADARRGQVYAQTFDASSDAVVALTSPQLLDIAAATDGARSHGAAVIAGSGAAIILARMKLAGIDERLPCALLEDLEPDALDLIGLAPSLVPLDDVRPLYIRPPDAKPPANPSLSRRD